MDSLDPFADEEPWANPSEPTDLDDWAHTRAQPIVDVPYELRARVARQGPVEHRATPAGRSSPQVPHPPGSGASPPVSPAPSHSGPHPGPHRHAPPAVDPTRDQARSRHRAIRAGGPFVALAVPILAGALTTVLWRVVSCKGSGCVAPGAAGWAFGALAAPTAPLAGIPWQTSTPTVIATLTSSVIVWLLVGRWAALRATAGPTATWGAYLRQLRNLAVGLWFGVLVGLGAMVALLTQT